MQTKALRGSRRPEPTFEARGARPGGVLNTAYLEAMDNDEYESESEADERPLQRDNLRRRNLDVSFCGAAFSVIERLEGVGTLL